MESEKDLISKRKSEHLHISLTKEVQSELSNGLEQVHFIHNALPEINYVDIDTTTMLFNKEISIPLLISSMTGGTQEAARINQRLAEAAQSKNIALAVGSQRAAIENPDLEKTFNIRRWAKDIPVFANLGAVQLNYGYTVAQCIKSIDMIEADGLILHLNPLQEALQPEGNTNFEGLLKRIEYICKNIKLPIIVKEVGWGISGNTAKRLINAGVAAIDVAGAGGTSWGKIEMERAEDHRVEMIAQPFSNWGIPTTESIKMVRKVSSQIKIFASGGVRNGIDVAKCLALGAELCGLASPFLKAAHKSTNGLQELIDIIQEQLKICMFVIGARDISEIDKEKLIEL